MRTIPGYRIPSPRPLDPIALEDVEDTAALAPFNDAIAALASIDDAEAPVVIERTDDERARDDLQPAWTRYVRAFAIGIAVAAGMIGLLLILPSSR